MFDKNYRRREEGCRHFPQPLPRSSLVCHRIYSQRSCNGSNDGTDNFKDGFPSFFTYFHNVLCF